METEKVGPASIVAGDRIVLWTTEADAPRGPRHYEVRTIRTIEEPDKTHPDSYDFELETPGADPRKFVAMVRIETADEIERVVESPQISKPWVLRE